MGANLGAILAIKRWCKRWNDMSHGLASIQIAGKWSNNALSVTACHSPLPNIALSCNP